MAMNIVYATDDRYCKPALISMKSLLMNNTEADEINIYYIGKSITDESKKMLTDLVDEYGRNIEFIPMPEEYSKISGLVRTHAVIYSYCYFQDILPKNVKKVLLLEADAIVVADLKELYETDLTGYLFAAADDMKSKWYKKKLNMRPDSPYINSGIMLFNLEQMRREHVSERITEIIQSGKSKYYYEVQDELNVLAEGRIRILPPKYNCTTTILVFDYETMLRYRRPSSCCTKEEFEEGRSHPVIIHFTSNQIIQPRPWMEGCTHPYRRCYDEIKSQTVLADMELWPVKRSWANRVVYALYSRGAEKFVATVLGWVQSFLFPVFLYRFI